jgi:hypothetical protein
MQSFNVLKQVVHMETLGSEEFIYLSATFFLLAFFFPFSYVFLSCLKARGRLDVFEYYISLAERKSQSLYNPIVNKSQGNKRDLYKKIKRLHHTEVVFHPHMGRKYSPFITHT